MLSVVFGLGTALMFATALLANSRALRSIGDFSLLAWVMIVGLISTLPFTFAAGIPAELDASNLMWLTLAGVGNVAGLLIAFQSMKLGKIGVIAPILATEGAIAAMLSAVMGETIAPIAAFVLMFIVAGVVVAGIAKDPAPIEHERPVLAVLFALVAATCFGTSLFAVGHLSGSLPIGWLLLPPRLVGVLVIAVPLIVMRKLELTRAAVPLVVFSGLAEVAGFTSYAIGATQSVAVTSVLASQFATIAAFLAFVLFKERLGRLQLTGLVMLVIGVAALSLVLNAA